MEAYYHLLKKNFVSKDAILTELINLEAITHLPKGTEYFVSDLHGEFAAFDYILRNASGAVKEKIEQCFINDQLSREAIDDLCLYIYYPEEKIARLASQLQKTDFDNQLMQIIPRLVKVVQFVGSKYTRSKVRKAMPKEFSYIIEELLSEIDQQKNKIEYFRTILSTVSSLGQLDNLVIALAYLIQNLVIDHLHMVGDIYDRGSYSDTIIDRLMTLRSVDIQWGNHDITWMGAMAGSPLCMVNIIRIAARYNNLEMIEDRYGINLRPLIDYSQKYYQPCLAFTPIIDQGKISSSQESLLNQLQQACAILQFKLEDQLIERRSEFALHHRQLLRKINFDKKEIEIAGQVYPLTNFNACCIDVEQPSTLSEEEKSILEHLLYRFQNSARLQQHVDFLLEKGSMYKVYNQQLLFHGCIPLHENGDFKSLRLGGVNYSGKALLDYYENAIRSAFKSPDVSDDLDTDFFWYLWIGESSSLFGKDAMTTFERYYIEDTNRHKEMKNPYFNLRNDVEVCCQILEEFGLDSQSHIINGHTPVKEKRGESPIKADGKMLVIDGGLAKGYQKQTGIAGYTLVFNSYGLQIVAHQPFTNVEDVLDGGCAIISTQRLVEEANHRILVKDTTVGQQIQTEIRSLRHLYNHFEEY